MRNTRDDKKSNCSNRNLSTSMIDSNSEFNNNKGKRSSSGYFNNKVNTDSNNIKVVIRIRPALEREINLGYEFKGITRVTHENKTCQLYEYLGAGFDEYVKNTEFMKDSSDFNVHRFNFDYVFDTDATQEEIYSKSAKSAIISTLEGYNSTIFAYGQTGTGKTYTMEGLSLNSKDSTRGIIPRTIDEIFNYINSNSSPNRKFMIRANYLQIYNESISDLLNMDTPPLHIRESKEKGVYVDGLKPWAVKTHSDIYYLLQKGASNRHISSTKMNNVSSRSHAIFIINIEQMDIENDKPKKILIGKINLVDLAGSERTRVTGAIGKQLEESKKINKSLSALGNVINALTDKDLKGRSHIPYRDSKVNFN